MPLTHDKKSVLLIEDNLGFRFLFKDALESQGYIALEAADGETGLEMAKKHRPYFILLDLMIPKLNGFEVLKHLRASPDTAALPVVVLSVLSEPKDIQKCLKLGANDYIVKGSETPEQIIRRSCGLLAKT